MDEADKVRLDRRFDWVGPPDAASRIRPIRLRQVLDESPLEKKYREDREELNRWCSRFWAEHNELFNSQKAAYLEKKKLELGRIEQVTAADLSEFYKKFLNERHAALMQFNSEWYRRNLGLIWPALRVNLVRMKRLLLRR